MTILRWLLLPVMLVLRLPYSIGATIWHARDLRQRQPTWTWRKRWSAHWWFFVLCMIGVVGPMPH